MWVLEIFSDVHSIRANAETDDNHGDVDVSVSYASTSETITFHQRGSCHVNAFVALSLLQTILMKMNKHVEWIYKQFVHGSNSYVCCCHITATLRVSEEKKHRRWAKEKWEWLARMSFMVGTHHCRDMGQFLILQA